MKRVKLLTLLGSICLVLILAVLLFIGACAPEAPPPPKPIELTMVTFLPAYVGNIAIYLKTIDRINEQAKGELVIKNLGGPEVVSEFELGMAVQTGTVDMGLNIAPFYAGLVPAASLVKLSEIRAWEERETGAYDFLVELHEKAGLFYLGRATSATIPNLFLFTNTYVETPYDLAGIKFAGGPGWDELLTALGIVSIPIPDAELYTALERGLVEGLGNPHHVLVSIGLTEVVKYSIDYGWAAGSSTVIVNLDKWNSLPEHLQNLIVDVQAEMERELSPEYDETIIAGKQDCIDAGVEPITFSAADAEWYLDTIFQAQYDRLLERAPEDVPKLWELLSK